MIVQCPACEQTYDLSTFPSDARFACSRCDHVLHGAQATESSEVLPAPPVAEQTVDASDAGVESASSSSEESAQETAASDEASSDEALPAADDLDRLDDLHSSNSPVEHTVRIKPPVQPTPEPQASEIPPAEAQLPVEEHYEDEREPMTRADLPMSVETHVIETPDEDEALHGESGEVERTAIASHAELQAQANASAEPSVVIAEMAPLSDDPDSMSTIASDPSEYHADELIAQGEELHKGTSEDTESTSVGVNPLLQAQSFLQDINQSLEDDILGQDESTAISRNPLLANPQESTNWGAQEVKMPPPGAYDPHHAQEVDEAAQTAFEMPRMMVNAEGQATPVAHGAPMVHVDMNASGPPHADAMGYAGHQGGHAAGYPQPAHPHAAAPHPTPSHPQPNAGVNFQKPSSWDSLDASGREIDDAELMVPQTDGRAIAGVLLLITFVLGPICLLLGWSANQRIQQTGSVFRGKGWAYLAMIGGAMQTLALGTLLVLFLLFPQDHPAMVFVIKTLRQFQSAPPRPDFRKMPPQPGRLTNARALKIIRSQLHHQGPAPLTHLFVHQEPKARYAYVHWRHPLLKRNQQSLFLYSNRSHWHLASFATKQYYEVRCSQAGPSRLSAKTARALIQQFWKVRGKFTGVRVAQLYVVQKPNTHAAHAYWSLTKQIPNAPIKQWKVKSLFHYSNDGKWYLSRYGIRIPKDELFVQEKAGSPRLTLELAKDLLTEHYKEKQRTFAALKAYVYQPKGRRHGYLHWQSGRQLYRSLFRYNNQGKWVLARLHVPPPYQLAYHEETDARLQQAPTKKMLQRYMRRNARQLLLKTFAKQGQKGKPPRRLPQIAHLYIYQPEKNKALARWQATFPKGAAFVESVLHRAPKGHWYLSIFQTDQKLDPRFGQKTAGAITATLAKELIQQYWQSDVGSEKFNGARIEALYLYRDGDPNLAWAHWRKAQGGLNTSMRTQFCRSNKGRWMLGKYDVGLGYSLSPSTAGQGQLSDDTASLLVKDYLKEKPRYKRATMGEAYVYQPPNASWAYVGWRLEERGQRTKVSHMTSLLHRSTDGRWYLSTFSLPELAP